MQLETNLGGGDIRQKLVYGLDLNATDTSRSRDNTEFNQTTGTQTKNVGGEAFTNFAQQYTVIPNANLKPETGDGFEIGVKTDGANFKGSLVGFYNRYDNFISTVQIGTVPINGQTLSQFQSQNIKGAEISGVEAKGEYRFSQQPGGLSLLTSAAFTQGNNLETNQPLDSIDPFKAVLGLRYRSSDNQWGTELVTTLVSAKDRNTTPTGFKTPAHTTFDLLSYYNFSPDTTFNLGLFNIFNTKYYQASDVRGLAENSRILDLYTQPGFNIAASLAIRF